jgi:DNA-binding NtrC family response regulator
MIAAAVLFAAGLAASHQADACGDKFLVPSRGVRFELSASMRQQAAILLYANQESSFPEFLGRLSIDPALRKAGYRPTVVATVDELDQAIHDRAWDIVLIDLSDGPYVNRQPQRANRPAVLVIARDTGSPQFATAKKLYADVIKTPKRSQTVIDAIDDAVIRRAVQLKSGKQDHP